jgi:hypothetical protein
MWHRFPPGLSFHKEAFNEGTNEEKDLELAALRRFPVDIDVLSWGLLLVSALRPLFWSRLPSSLGWPKRTIQERRRPKISARECAEQKPPTRAAGAERGQFFYQRLR